MGRENSRVAVGRFAVATNYSLAFVFAVAWVCDGCGAPIAAAPTCSTEPKKSVQQPVEKTQQSETESVQRAFGTWQVIGEGSRFLTVKIDLARELDHGAEISALVLGSDRVPLRHLTGYAVRPDLPVRNHLWFFFLVYAPREVPQQMRQSKFIRFSFKGPAGVEVDKTVAYEKTWQTEGDAKIFDLPAPGAEVEGFLVLKDYVFLARGDPRKPDGYYVEGKIIGERGSYTRFEAISEIKGEEPEPEVSLEAQRGWLELSNGTTHAMQEAVAPVSPYVNGWWDGKGYFHPDPPVIY